MKNNSQKSLFANRILDKIRTGRIKMRPKAHFILKTVLIILSIVVVALFALYLISFINFSLRASGACFLSGFGFHGIGILITSLPWLLIIIAVLLIIVLEILVKRFGFAYRQPILYSILTVIVLVFLGSFIINKTRFHSGLFSRAQEGRLPVAGKLYRGFGMKKSGGAHLGVVFEITDDGFRIETRDNQILTVIITSDTRFPFDTDIKENDTVMVLGKQENEKVHALGIRKIDDKINGFPRFPVRMRLPR